MTRINCVPVTTLTNRHLLAEYKELPRISNFAAKFKGVIPSAYCLGKGHMSFFADKGEYLRRRFEEEIVPELTRRGFKLAYTKYRMHPEGRNKDWMPDEEAKLLNLQRILERLI